MLGALVSLVVVPFALAGAVSLLARAGPRWTGRLALAAPALVVVLGLWLWEAAETTRVFTLPWLPSLGLSANLRLDRLGAFFILLIGLVGLGVVQYARHYFGDEAHAGFWAQLLLFMGAMLGLVVCDNLLLLFVFWELTTIASALLIATHHEDPEARRGAVQAFLVTDAGSLAMLAGIVLLALRFGATDLSALEADKVRIVADPAHFLPMVLLLLGAFSKSAQFPFHFWLPGAMAAPAPVSAYLHSATMVKAGIFLIARLFPIFGLSTLWEPLLVTVGLLTFVVAGWSALRSHDIKRLLAFSTAAYLGMLVAQYGYAARAGWHDDLVSIANHALYKSALFLLAGWIEKVTGTRDLRTLAPERWARYEPAGTALVAVGVLAMSGAPLLLGFLAKELFFGGLLDYSAAFRPAMVMAVLGGALAFAYSFRVLIETFWGWEHPQLGRGYPRREVSGWLLLVPAALLVPQLLGGLASAFFLQPILRPGSELPAGPAVWHHLDLTLVLSLATYAVGAAIFFARGALLRWRRLPGTDAAAAGLAGWTLRGATRLGLRLQAGGHPKQMSWILAFALAAVGATVWAHGGVRWPAWDDGPDPALAWLPAVLVAGSAAAVLVLRRRIAKVLLAAITGYGTALFYVLFRAPDLVLTQILVETLSLLLLLLAFARLPRLGPDERRPAQRRVHASVALATGLLVALLGWSAGSSSPPDPAGSAQLARSLPEAKGANAVNVVLVDFRGADTLGEITVLAIAALGAVALLGAGLGRRKEVRP